MLEAVAARPVADAEGEGRHDGREGERERDPAARARAGGLGHARNRLRERLGHLVRGRRHAPEESVGVTEALQLAGREVVADELAEIRRLLHGLTSSRRPPMRASPVRVRVLTVPRGTSR